MWFSLTNFSIGFAISIVLGVVIGVPMGWYRGVHKGLRSAAFRDLCHAPLIALLPLIIMMFGLGSISKIIMTILAAVFRSDQHHGRHRQHRSPADHHVTRLRR
jgi:NitT/TauT family transport system permease protein